jgi:cytochrome c-type protein NapB
MRSVIYALLTSVFLLSGLAAVAEPAKEADDGIDVWFRDADIEAMSDQELAKYIETAAGESKRMERSWSDAPPSIPHTVEDMLPITSDDNECAECHHPENTTSKDDLPLPDTHFEQVVVVDGKKNEAMRNKVDGYRKAEDLVGSRYNCMMCHAPQAGNVKSPKNSFKGDEAKK